MVQKYLLSLLFVFVVFSVLQYSSADFLYNPSYKEISSDNSDFKCIPGRTVISISSDRYHRAEDESCKICICSVEGKDEQCLTSPANSVNECLRLKKAREYMKNHVFDHTRLLYQRIRRDYIWHKDEIPYEATAQCRRGTSYYTNNPLANQTQVQDEQERLLGYRNRTVCFFCVCHTSGMDIVCLKRSLWTCAYFRYLALPGAAREMYAKIFEHDRPGYFRTLSTRLRRTMETGVYDLIAVGGDALCCGHQSGHVRNLHNSVKNRMRMLRRKIRREDLIDGNSEGDYVDFVVNNDK